MLIATRSLLLFSTLCFFLTSGTDLHSGPQQPSDETSSSSFVCPGNRVLNGDFDAGNIPGGIFGPGHVDDWTGSTGVCEVFAADGCSGGSVGSVGMLGRQDGGDMMHQQQGSPIFESGKTYSVNLCVRYLDNPPLPLVQIYVDRANHVRFRVSASNGPLGNYLDPAGVTVGATAQLTVDGAWLTVTLPNWTSPADYNTVTVHQFNDNPMPDSSYGEVDRICISEVVPFCPGNVVVNGDFDGGNIPGGIFGPGHVDDWTGATGVVEVFAADGCGGSNSGSVGMLGRQDAGDMMYQFNATPIFQAGKTYSVTLCARYLDDPPLPLVQIYVDDANHVRFRLSASNQVLGNYSDPAAVTIGETPQLSVNGIWVTMTLPDWTAPVDYQYLSVHQFNDNPMPDSSWGEIDKICITEVIPFCPDNLVLNGDLDAGNIPGGINGPGHVDDWTGSTGVPEVFTADGCSGTNIGSVGMLGRQDAGDMMHQTQGAPIFQTGKTYSVSMCVRYLDDPPLPLVQIYVDDANHVRFRVSASNAPLGTYLDPAGQIVGETPQLTVNGAWATITLPNWTSPGDYNTITINQFNDNPMPDSSYGEVDKICVTEVPSSSAAYAYGGGWNLISQPVIVLDDTVTHIFPSAVSLAYAYDPGGYVTHVEFQKPRGYWLKLPVPETLAVVGTSVDSMAIPLFLGWNLIGSITSPVGVATIVSVAGGLVTSPFYGYNGGYYVTDSVRPGYGYWVNVSDTGWLILDTTPGPIQNRITVVPSTARPPEPPGDFFGAEDVQELPSAFSLGANFPNPFNPTTMISYDLPAESSVKISVFDVLGRELAVLVDGVQAGGYRSVEFDAANSPSGIYFYRLDAVSTEAPHGSFTAIRKMLLMR